VAGRKKKNGLPRELGPGKRKERSEVSGLKREILGRKNRLQLLKFDSDGLVAEF
jgi:hypothetical protein